MISHLPLLLLHLSTLSVTPLAIPLGSTLSHPTPTPPRPGYVRWYIDGVFRFGIEGSSLTPWGTKIPDEPSYIILNTAISTSWGFLNPPWGCTEYDCKVRLTPARSRHTFTPSLILYSRLPLPHSSLTHSYSLIHSLTPSLTLSIIPTYPRASSLTHIHSPSHRPPRASAA